MAKYKIVGEETDLRHRNSIEINGKIRFAGEVLDESEFKAGTGNQYVESYDAAGKPVMATELSELESLLKSKHVTLINE